MSEVVKMRGEGKKDVAATIDFRFFDLPSSGTYHKSLLINFWLIPSITFIVGTNILFCKWKYPFNTISRRQIIQIEHSKLTLS